MFLNTINPSSLVLMQLRKMYWLHFTLHPLQRLQNDLNFSLLPYAVTLNRQPSFVVTLKFLQCFIYHQNLRGQDKLKIMEYKNISEFSILK